MVGVAARAQAEGALRGFPLRLPVVAGGGSEPWECPVARKVLSEL